MRLLLRSVLAAVLCGSTLAVPAPAGERVEQPEQRERSYVSIPRTLVRSARLVAPRRTIPFSFPATHVVFTWHGGEKAGVEFRTISNAGATSRWRRAHENHDLERGSRHASGVLAVSRPVALEWRPAGPGTRRVRLDWLNTLDGPERLVAVPEAQPAAAPGAPRIVTRAEWGADESMKRTSASCRRRFFRVQQLFVHHTAGSNFDRHPKATMRAIYWYHTVRQGWCDVGYNFVIGQDGRIFEGRWARPYKPWELHSSENRRGLAVAGAHVAGYNSGSVGVSLMGNFENAPLPPVMRRVLAELLAWEVDRHGLKTQGNHTYVNPETGLTRRLPYIAGHRDAGQTACPGGNVYRSLGGIRRDTKAAIGVGKATTALTFATSEISTVYGSPVTLTGSLHDELGASLAERTVTLYRREGDLGWEPAGSATTAADGSVSFSLMPSSNMRLLAVYDGDTTTWGSQSARVRIGVAPTVSLALQGLTPDSSGVYHLPSGTRSVVFEGTVAPPHPGETVTVQAVLREPDGSVPWVGEVSTALDAQSAFTLGLTIPMDGTYTASAFTFAHGDHSEGESPMMTFVVGDG